MISDSQINDGKSCLKSILRPLGDGNSCKSKECTCGTCGKKLDNGLSCTTNENCKSGWCGPEVSLFCTGTCRGRKRDYEECSLEFFDSGDDSSCASGNCLAVSFTKAVCAPKKGFKEGSQCNEDVDCDKTQNLWCKGGAFYSTGRCRQCPARCPDGCNALFNQDLQCGRKTFIERIAEEIRDVGTAIAHFFECLVPDTVKSCISDVVRSAKDCLNVKKPCRVKMGGKGSSCLAVEETRLSYKHEEGSLGMSGDVTTKGAFGVTVDFTNGKIIADFSGSFGINQNLNIKADKAHVQPRITKKLYLTDCEGTKCLPCSNPTNSYSCLPKTVFRRAFVIGYMPVIIEMKVQIVAYIDFEVKAMGGFNITTSYNKAEAVKINSAKAILDFSSGGSLKVSIDKALKRDLARTVVIRNGIDIMAAVRIGPEISFVIDGIPINIFTGIRFTIDGLVPKLPVRSTTSLCLDGYFKAGLGVDVGIGIDAREMSFSRLLGSACSGVVTVACYLDKAVNCMAQAIKAGKTKFHPCNKMKTYCSIMEKKVASVFLFQMGKSEYATDVQIPVEYLPILVNGFKICEGSPYKQSNLSATIGSTTLQGIGEITKTPNVKKKKKKSWWAILFGKASSLEPTVIVFCMLALSNIILHLV